MIQVLAYPLSKFLHDLGAIWLFQWNVLKTFLTTRGNLGPILDQIIYVTTRTFSTVIFAGIFAGAIICLQFNLILSEYDAQTFLGGLNTSTVVRGIGPLIISTLLAGKVGAYTAAELGTMRVTEQIEAIECLGTNPIQYLIVPRYIGIILSSLILLMVGLLVSVCGSMAIASVVCGINTLEFTNSIPKFTSLSTIAGGLFKCVVYGTIVAAVSCQQGFHTTGGARGVGRAVTRSAVYINFYIVIANYLTSAIIESTEDLAGMLSHYWRGVGGL